MAAPSPLRHNAYLADILDQPAALRRGLAQFQPGALAELAALRAAGAFDRIVLTGMGASYYGLYPAYLHLAAAGLPATWIDAAELLHHAPRAAGGAKTLLWVASQSGRSAEVVSLLEKIEAGEIAAPAALLAISNNADSPVAAAVQRQAARRPGSGVYLPLHAAPEDTPSTRTYQLTLALCQLAALALTGEMALDGASLQARLDELLRTADGIEAYLRDWELRMGEIGAALVGVDERAALPALALLGRGPSFTTVQAGALNLQEAAKIPALGVQAAEFRHGPLEMAGPSVSALLFEGAPGAQADLMRKLWTDLRRLGVRAALLGQASGDEGCLPLPAWAGIGRPLAEIVPVQLLAVYACMQTGVIPGTFRHIGKVTDVE